MNPAYDFYALLHRILLGRGRSRNSAPALVERLLEIYNGNRNLISLPEVTADNLRTWRVQIEDESLPGDPGVEILTKITRHMFADMSSQFRTPAVRSLRYDWTESSGMLDANLIYLKRVVEIAENIGVVVIVTNNVSGFRDLLNEMCGPTQRQRVELIEPTKA